MSVVYSPPADPSTLSARQLAVDLRSVITLALPKLRAVTEQQAANPLKEGKWSSKQILGHLIDSAANNWQRFVRLQIEPELRLPGYQQEQWVAVQHYQQRSWTELIALWEPLNLHLVDVIENTAQQHLDRQWIREDETFTLGFIMQDYTAHMRHHLRQLFPEHATPFGAK